MPRAMAFLAQCDEVFRTVRAALRNGQYMVDVQLAVRGRHIYAVAIFQRVEIAAVLAGEAVPAEYMLGITAPALPNGEIREHAAAFIGAKAGLLAGERLAAPFALADIGEARAANGPKNRIESGLCAG